MLMPNYQGLSSYQVGGHVCTTGYSLFPKYIDVFSHLPNFTQVVPPTMNTQFPSVPEKTSEETN